MLPPSIGMIQFFLGFIIYLIIVLAISIIGLIGSIYYGLFVYQIGKNLYQNVLKIGGILFIVYLPVGNILIYLGLKKLSMY